jgi:CRP-like cAMP-binding protein
MALRKDAKIELLERIPLFAQCSKGDLERIARIAEEIDFEAGDLLMREDERGHEVFVVVSGRLEVWRRREGGQIADLGPGEVVGEMALLSKKPRNATVRAATPVHLLRIRDTDFLKLLDQVPELWLKIASALADRVPDEGRQVFYHD